MKTLKPKLRVLTSSLKRLKPHTAAGTWRAGKESSNARGYTYQWQKASKAFLAEPGNQLCCCPDCLSGAKRIKVATVVDHEPPHRGDMVKFWDRSTWRPMAKTCHDAKTQRETAATR